MTDSPLPKQLLRGELCQGKHSVGGQKKRFKDWLRHDRLLLTLAGASLRTQTYFRLSLLSAAYFRRRDINPKAENPSAFAGLAGAGLASLAGALLARHATFRAERLRDEPKRASPRTDRRGDEERSGFDSVSTLL